jgi:hypothetical protein
MSNALEDLKMALSKKRAKYSEFVGILPFDQHVKQSLRDVEGKIVYEGVEVQEATAIMAYNNTLSVLFVEDVLPRELGTIKKAVDELKLAEMVDNAHR